MIVRLEAFLRRMGRLARPEEWIARFQGMAAPAATGLEPGLVLIQIDGLGHAQFERALARGHLPCLARLIRREAYVAHRHYAGLPSSTPAVQATLFYGVRTAVPAFSYRDQASGRIFNMFLPGCASAVEGRLRRQGGRPLLEGGSAYGDIYTGGAAEPHFCAAAVGWGSLLRPLRNPFGLALAALLYLPILARMAVLGTLELGLALYDGVRALGSGRFFRELAYLPLRVAVCVQLREAIAAGARVDTVRGLPVIHVNFAGYDEQAHHRGPRSRFAHWTLRGIDRAIEGIWRAAQRSRRRDYDIFIYSDHGQESTTPYAEVAGCSIAEAVNRVFREQIVSARWRAQASRGEPGWRARAMQERPGRAGPEAPPPEGDAAVRVLLAAMGPVGHLYPPARLSPEERDLFAEQLVSAANVPLVLVADAPGTALAWTPDGRFTLPAQAECVLDAGQPFFAEVVEDLVELCHHPDAGAFVILGWREGAPLSFADEQGAHAGPGREETCGFALLPADALPGAGDGALRTLDLRAAALHSLTHGHDRAMASREAGRAGSETLRIMTYNVHGCAGRDGKVAPSRIGRIIARHNPDIVCLQELDVLKDSHQAEVIAEKLEMVFQYHSAFTMKKGLHGNAVLSRFPMRLVASGFLPRLSTSRIHEPRGALWVEIDLGSERLQLVNTHLSLLPSEGLLQADALLGPAWLGRPGRKDPVILCGDFNAVPGSRVCRRLDRALRNAQLELPGHAVQATLPSFYPLRALDHVYLGAGVEILSIEVPRTDLERMASDHLPLIARVALPRAAAAGRAPESAAGRPEVR